MTPRRKFVPGEIRTLEDRALLSGGFKFPHVLGPVATLGYQGAHVLTSRTYAQIQNTVNKAIQDFGKQVMKAYHDAGGFTDQFYAIVGVRVGMSGEIPGGQPAEVVAAGVSARQTSGPAVYAPGTLLAKVDGIMAGVEKRLPYGGGYAGATGGAGLSTYTALTTENPAVIALDRLSVAEQLENAVLYTNTPAACMECIEQVRQVTLNIVGNAPLAQGTGAIPGSLPSYVYNFGPGGARFFGLRNSRH